MIWCFLKMECQRMLYLLQLWIFIHPGSGNMHNAPNDWILDFPQCGGKMQSPINLRTDQSIKIKANSISLKNYYVNLEILLFNNGETINMKILFDENDEIPILFGGGLNDVYEAQSLHFHWGRRGVKGSEHAIDGEKYDLELHILHKSSEYESFYSAVRNHGGLLIMVVLFEEDENGKGDIPMPSGLTQYCNIADSLTLVESTSSYEEPIALKSFIENLDLKTFFVYNGSLTSPPCTQGITWLVFSHVLPIETYCLEKFWTVMDDDNNPLLETFRPIQEAFSRPIHYRTGRRPT